MSVLTRWRVLLALAVLAAIQLGGTLGAAHNREGFQPLDALAIVLVLAGPVLIGALWRYPILMVWSVTGVTLAYLLRGYAYGPVILSLVVVVVAAVMRGHRWTAWAAMATTYVVHFVLRWVLLDVAWSWPAGLGVAAWALVILIAAEFARSRRERLLVARRAQAETERREAGEERLRLAQELHDVVAHHMSLINVQAGVALHVVDRRPEQAQTALTAIKDASREALTEMRRLVGALRDESEGAPRVPVSTLDSLDTLVERSAHAQLDVRVERAGSPRTLSAAVELAAFRIIQEAITNVVRHAEARHARVRLDYGEDVLHLRVDDDGHGFAHRSPAGDTGEGRGLRGMRERARALGGVLRVESAPSGGVRISADLPLDDA